MSESIHTPYKTYENGVPEAANHVQPSGSASLLDALLVLIRRRNEIGRTIVLFLAGGLVWGLAAPYWYTARVKLLPPNENQSMSTLMEEFGPLANLGSRDLSFKDPNDKYVAILRSRSVTEPIVTRFRLQDRYKQGTIDDCLKKLADHTEVSAGQDSIITVAVEDKDPIVAAQIANAYVSEFVRVSSRTLMSTASQRRLFFDQQLRQAKDDLANAEAELKGIQEKTGLIDIDNQTRAIISSAAELRAQVGAAEVRLQAMKTFATPQNPDYIRAQLELSALRAQLAQSERGAVRGQGDMLVPTGKIPSAGLQYVRQLREVKYRTLLVELITKQFEIARLDEGNTLSVAQVLDPAVPPEKRSSPRRGLLLGLALMVGTLAGIARAFLSESLQSLEQHPESAARLQLLREQFAQLKRSRWLMPWTRIRRSA